MEEPFLVLWTKEGAGINYTDVFVTDFTDVIANFSIKEYNAAEITPANLADYYIENKLNLSLPLVADYSGAAINVCVQAVDEEKKEVSFFGPVLRGQEYSIAEPIDDLFGTFSNALPKDTSGLICSCNCMLNYVNIEMENKLLGDYRGPFTFGEIAYVLVNQTMVTLSLREA